MKPKAPKKKDTKPQAKSGEVRVIEAFNFKACSFFTQKSDFSCEIDIRNLPIYFSQFRVSYGIKGTKVQGSCDGKTWVDID